ncbi:Uncharacterised protein [Orientia tsutsugamushi]|uniref:AHH domain-containing protein n=1 Tax=Orientia tsutsugamushi TaxID=784 RepID=UPI0005F89FD8|nr:AHH domain-containing protein [Orientia tsutsugamushi]KJV73719.1 A nuclease of the HNH/ENDO VII superwith conserved AHH family protein [Orientia tsutsugamushi str. TA763]SPP26490.1 Uncharacterised protein [Orientia tsutsugamushi]
MKLQQLLGLPGEAQSIAYSLEAVGTWSGNLNQESFNTYKIIELNQNNWKYKYDYYTTNYIIQALYQLEKAINADYSGVKSELIENCKKYITQKILYKVRAEVFGHVTHAASQKLSNYVFDGLSKIKQELNKQKEERIRKDAIHQGIVNNIIKNANDTVALLEKQHKDLINSIVARISAEEAFKKDAFANYNFASPNSELLATLVKTHEDLIAKILIADPSTNKNSATPPNDQQHLVTWKGHKISVNNEEKPILVKLYNIGYEYLVSKYLNCLAGINEIGKSDVQNFRYRMTKPLLELLLNPNIGAILFEGSGQCLIWTTEQLNKITAQYFPKTRAVIETAMDITKDAVVELSQYLPECVTKRIFVLYEKSKTLYLNLTENLSEGRKALVDFTLGCAAGEALGGVVGLVGGAVEGAVAASNTSNILKKISPIKVLVDQTGINNHTTVALIAKTEDKVAAIFNVEKKDVGKIIANANIPNEKICLVDLNILKQKFGDTSLSIIQKLEKEEILLPKLPHVVANLQEGTSVVRFVSYGSNRDRGIKIGSKLGTQTHHLIPQQFLKEEIFNFCGIDIKNDVCNKMILYTPKGLKLATESSNIVRDTYAKMLKQLNPSLTQKEIQIISEWKVPLPNKQRSTHSGRHDNSYVLPIKEKLHDLWDDVKLGKLNKKECRKAVYDLMDELREGIKNGSTELNKPK